MPDLGYSYWDPMFLVDPPWFDGAVLAAGGLPLQQPIDFSPGPGVLLLQSHADTDILQVPYAGSKSPAQKSRLTFSFILLGDFQEDYYRFKAARAKARPVYFCPGMRQVEAFDAISGTIYQLSRPLATGIVSGVSEGSHPTLVYLNGVLTPSAATVAGQSVTANASGVILVRYTPVHQVVVAELREQIIEENRLDVAITLQEVVLGTFD